MFCGLNEAFEADPLKKQLKEFEQEQYKQHVLNSVNKDQRIYNNITNNTIEPSYYDAQGDITKCNKQGTTIKDLKKQQPKDESSLGSLLDDSMFSSEGTSLGSILMDDTLTPTQHSVTKIKDRSHEYYIRNFIKDFGDMESKSLSKSEYTDTYDHIKTCKFCKNEIKLRMNYTASNTNTNNPIKITNLPIASNDTIKNQNQLEPFGSFSLLSNNTDIKEIVVIVLIGIVIIFLLDLCTKINKILTKGKHVV